MRIRDWSSDVCSSDLFFHDGMVSINVLREATDASDPEWFTRTECSLRENLQLIIEILRREFPEFRDCWLAKSGIQTGVRESYHIVGLYDVKKDRNRTSVNSSH